MTQKPETRRQRSVAPTRWEGLNGGFLLYRAKRPCIHGHEPLRYVTTGKCVECKKRSPSKKARRRELDKIRRKKGTLTSWSWARRSSTPDGHKALMLQRARYRAAKRGLIFDLTTDDFHIPSHCPILGLKLSLNDSGTPGPRDTSPTLDRIDNRKGYVRGNVEVISWRANRLKSDATPRELRQIANHYD